MSAATLLDHLMGAGIRLGWEGDDLIADVLPGVNLDPYREEVATHKTALLAELRLREQIVSAASAAQASFDRQRYDELWGLWSARQEETA